MFNNGYNGAVTSNIALQPAIVKVYKDNRSNMPLEIANNFVLSNPSNNRGTYFGNAKGR
ncbi:hypothetical protein BOVMAS27_16500 [Streptococcus uberis]